MFLISGTMAMCPTLAIRLPRTFRIKKKKKAKIVAKYQNAKWVFKIYLKADIYEKYLSQSIFQLTNISVHFFYHIKLIKNTAAIFSNLIFCEYRLYFKYSYSFPERTTQILPNPAPSWRFR